VTELEDDALAGLAGMMLTLADLEAGRASDGGSSAGSAALALDLYGPPRLADYVYASRFIYKRPGTTIRVHQLAGGSVPAALDAPDGFRVVPIPVVAAAPPRDGHGEPPAKRVCVGGGDRDTSNSQRDKYPVPVKFGKFEVVASGPNAEPADAAVAVSYLFEAPVRRGKFLPDKARALGVAPGPDFGKLTKGMSVKTSAGRTVRPEDCMEDAEPAQRVLVIACPSLDWVPGLLGAAALRALHGDPSLMFVVWLAPVAVLRDPRVCELAAALGLSTAPPRHVLVNRNVCPNRQAFASSAAVQRLLAQADQELFPEDRSGGGAATALADAVPEFLAATRGACLRGDMLMQLAVYPKSARGVHEAPEAPPPQTPEDAPAPAHPDAAADEPPADGYQLTFLGTGAALPSKYRNVSAILLRLRWHAHDAGAAAEDPADPQDAGATSCALMLDCGEGTYGQLVRRLGAEHARRVASRELRLVWISHMHADHHLGLLSLLRQRSRAAPPLVIVGPDALEEFLRDCLSGDGSLSDNYRFYAIRRSTEQCSELPAASGDPKLRALLARMGIERITSIPVIHCFNSYGVLLELRQGRRLVYSGDTRPCQRLIEAGRGAHVLIHEATFEEDKIDEAVAKKHATTSEAVAVGARMGAAFTILTHFSQRYPKVSPDGATGNGASTGNAAAATSTKVIVASDLMSIRSDQLDRAVGAAAQVASILEKLEHG
jgi:ribonuclease Z